MTKTGPGTLVLNAGSTYAGQTTVSQGALKSGSASAFASSSNIDQIVASLASLPDPPIRPGGVLRLGFRHPSRMLV
ncbi:autotransporter-associated beta strand repeat-containing protein [Sinorhizobium meliloti]|uniref:autotransporter-associated beta strand repeat-containing protein n=1 Tax=Rhizobium meliloti TaxID=382 RepID=UPI000FD85A96|nr:hypothetical protein CN231_21855 [Sinorhizobium meliloti]